MAERHAPLGVGIVGCGNISSAYLDLAPLFGAIEVRACADLDAARARERAAQFGVAARGVEELLASDDVDVVVNLTVPAAHAEVSRLALEADKHVYSEKPLALSVADGEALVALAAERGRRIGSAPDTFLGGAQQRARALVDSGALGRVTGATAHVMSFGMEHWHPDPDFFYRPGAGPVLDVGPYYVTALVQLLGPVAKVSAMSATPRAEREIGSAPRAGERVLVQTPTTVHATLEFEGGALATFGASWDVEAHGHRPIELYGERATLALPDPNFFGGALSVERRDGAPESSADADHPFGVANRTDKNLGPVANYRTVGLADMAAAILEGRPHRCSESLALHALDVMTSILAAAETGRTLCPSTRCERPAPLDADAARALLA